MFDIVAWKLKRLLMISRDGDKFSFNHVIYNWLIIAALLWKVVLLILVFGEV